MAKVEIALTHVANPDDHLWLEITGSDEWVKETMTCVHGLLDAITENSPFDIADPEEVMLELQDAFEMAKSGDSYAGQIVTTSLGIGIDNNGQS